MPLKMHFQVKTYNLLLALIQLTILLFLGKEVDVYREDYYEKYEDVGGGFGEPGEIYSLADMKVYWNENNQGDPSLEVFDSFDSW